MKLSKNKKLDFHVHLINVNTDAIALSDGIDAVSYQDLRSI
jgi:hypothetical protein